MGDNLTSTSLRHPPGVWRAENLLPSMLVALERLVSCAVGGELWRRKDAAFVIGS